MDLQCFSNAVNKVSKVGNPNRSVTTSTEFVGPPDKLIDALR